jgi:hypothetical protein
MLQYPTKDMNRETNTVGGSFRTNGNGVIDNTLNVGIGFTATRAGVGIVDVKLLQPARSLLHFRAELWDADLTNRRIQNVSKTLGTDGCWTVRITLTDLNNAGVVAQELPASDATHFISFDARLQLGSA